MRVPYSVGSALGLGFFSWWLGGVLFIQRRCASFSKVSEVWGGGDRVDKDSYRTWHPFFFFMTVVCNQKLTEVRNFIFVRLCLHGDLWERVGVSHTWSFALHLRRRSLYLRSSGWDAAPQWCLVQRSCPTREGFTFFRSPVLVRGHRVRSGWKSEGSLRELRRLTSGVPYTPQAEGYRLQQIVSEEKDQVKVLEFKSINQGFSLKRLSKNSIFCCSRNIDPPESRISPHTSI